MMNKGSTYEGDVEQREDVCVIKHGLKIPINVENYETFVSGMQVYETEFRKVLVSNARVEL